MSAMKASKDEVTRWLVEKNSLLKVSLASHQGKVLICPDATDIVLFKGKYNI
jgi:hypothetical protein